MSQLLFRNIKGLVGTFPKATLCVQGPQMKDLPLLTNAYLLVEDDRIRAFGPMPECPEPSGRMTAVDASGRYLLPSWCDSHTHLVFAGSREAEFVDRIRGLTYAEIAERGGGILNSARRLQHLPEEELLASGQARLEEIQAMGTGAVEIKSGYGLSPEAELKMLRVIRTLKERNRMPVKATFLGAHALPAEYAGRREAYVELILTDMLPRIADEGLADYVDVFCEKGFFTLDEMNRILDAAAGYGLVPKVHVNQFNSLGGVAAAVARRARSVDHLEVLNDADLEALCDADTVATLLPSAPFFLKDPYPPARKLLDNPITVALATDFNPGSSPSGNMPFVLSLACLYMGMLPEEAIAAATLNGAYAIDLAEDFGSIAPGKMANLSLTRPIPSLAYLPYAFGSQLIERCWIGGREVSTGRQNSV